MAATQSVRGVLRRAAVLLATLGGPVATAQNAALPSNVPARSVACGFPDTTGHFDQVPALSLNVPAGQTARPDADPVKVSSFEPMDFRFDGPPQRMSSADDAWDDYRPGWHTRFRFAPWLASLDGTVGKGAFRTDVDASFSDLFDKLNMGAALNVEVGNGPFTILAGGLYMHFKDDVTGPIRGRFKGDFESDFGLADVALAYRFLHEPFGSKDLSLEAIGGLRWTYLSASVDVKSGLLAGRSDSRDINWFDPYVGLRGRLDLDRHWDVAALGTIGGFGVGSDLTWSAYGELEYRFNPNWSAFVGYRALSYDYNHHGFTWDVTMHGPLIGIGLRF